MSRDLLEQALQEEQYSFPYHYLPRHVSGKYSQSIAWSWGYQYLAALEFILAKLESVDAGSILDVGCGDGRLVNELASTFTDARVAGIDYSDRAIALATAINPGLEFHAADITSEQAHDALGTFEAVTLIEVLEHIPVNDVSHFLQGVRSIMGDSAALLITVPHRNVSLSPKHFQHFDEASLRSVLDEQFEVTEIKFLHRNTRGMSRLLWLANNGVLNVYSPHVASRLYRAYKRWFFETDAAHAARIYARVRPR